MLNDTKDKGNMIQSISFRGMLYVSKISGRLRGTLVDPKCSTLQQTARTILPTERETRAIPRRKSNRISKQNNQADLTCKQRWL
jgi:hypothetical protein